ncbi:MAG: hypothetical protein RR425_00180 [Erysipelotrichales bacterium]
MKVILDFKNKESLDIINCLADLKYKKNIEVDILAFDIENKNTIERSYFALYYAKNYGVEYEFSKRVLEAYHLEDKNISKLDVLASCYEDIGYDRNDMIDSLMDGDYNDMYNHIQRSYQEHYHIKDACTIIKEDKTKIEGYSNILNYLKDK